MADPTPINPSVAPLLDVEREMLDVCALKLRLFASMFGEPDAIAVVVMDAQGGCVTKTWSPKKAMTMRIAASLAGAALLEYAMKD